MYKIVMGYVSLSISAYTFLAQGMCVPHSSTVGESVWNQLDRVLSVSGANKVIYQSDIPYTISAAGAYSVGEDLTNTGTASPTIILSNANAVLDLQGHSIIASANANTAIAASAGVVQNGVIKGFPIGITSTGNVPIIKDISFVSCATGILTGDAQGVIAEGCEGFSCDVFHGHFSSSLSNALLIIDSCDITNCLGAAFSYTGARGAIIDGCTVEGAAAGISCNNSQSILVSESIFSNITHDGVSMTNGSAMLHVEDCRFTGVGGNGVTLSGVSSLSEVIDTNFVNVTSNGIDNSGSGTAFNVFLKLILTNITGIGVNDAVGSNAATYANFLATVGTAFSGGSPIQRTPAQVSSNLTSFWQNIVDV